MKQNAREIAELLLKVPYFLKPGPIPPLRIMNDLTRRGESDLGMGKSFEWKPFSLTEEQYAEVISELRTLLPGLSDVAPPNTVQNYEDWRNWRLVHGARIHKAELSELIAKSDELEKAIAALGPKGDPGERAQLQLRLVEISSEISDLLANSR